MFKKLFAGLDEVALFSSHDEASCIKRNIEITKIPFLKPGPEKQTLQVESSGNFIYRGMRLSSSGLYYIANKGLNPEDNSFGGHYTTRIIYSGIDYSFGLYGNSVNKPMKNFYAVLLKIDVTSLPGYQEGLYNFTSETNSIFIKEHIPPHSIVDYFIFDRRQKVFLQLNLKNKK